jgi:hypothetical protein
VARLCARVAHLARRVRRVSVRAVTKLKQWRQVMTPHPISPHLIISSSHRLIISSHPVSSHPIPSQQAAAAAGPREQDAGDQGRLPGSARRHRDLAGGERPPSPPPAPQGAPANRIPTALNEHRDSHATRPLRSHPKRLHHLRQSATHAPPLQRWGSLGWQELTWPTEPAQSAQPNQLTQLTQLRRQELETTGADAAKKQRVS